MVRLSLTLNNNADGIGKADWVVRSVGSQEEQLALLDRDVLKRAFFFVHNPEQHVAFDLVEPLLQREHQQSKRVGRLFMAAYLGLIDMKVIPCIGTTN